MYNLSAKGKMLKEKVNVLSAVARGGAGGARAPPVFSLKSKNRPL